MFSGQAGCFCCSDPPDPPPPCDECLACGGSAPGTNCDAKVCSSFVIEIEGFANATNAQFNRSGCNSAGTQCGAYNGTFVLDRVAGTENCVYQSDAFTATVPIWTEINRQYCWECENVPVFYRLTFLFDSLSGWSGYRSYLTLHKESDGIPFAYFMPLGERLNENDNLLPWYANFAAMLCHEEGIDHFEASSGYPMHHGIYVSNYDAQGLEYDRLFGRAFCYGSPVQPLPFPNAPPNFENYGAGLFMGTGARFVYDMIPQLTRVVDECNKDTQFDVRPDNPDNSNTEGLQIEKVGSPHWICCKDDSFTCDTVTEIANGQAMGKFFTFWRVNSIRCGT